MLKITKETKEKFNEVRCELKFSNIKLSEIIEKKCSLELEFPSELKITRPPMSVNMYSITATYNNSDEIIYPLSHILHMNSEDIAETILKDFKKKHNEKL